MHAFGAVFVEVRVDEDLGRVRVPRIVGVYGVGNRLNEKTAHSQLMGGIVWGVGMALFEESLLDVRNGRFVNANLSEYHVPVERRHRQDRHRVRRREGRRTSIRSASRASARSASPASPAAIANAVYHATGVRVRDLPITLDKLLTA